MSADEWIPVTVCDQFNVIIAKKKDGYESTEDAGKTWRKSTEEEIKASGM